MAENVYIKEALETLQTKRQEAQWIIDDARRQADSLQSRTAPKVLVAQEKVAAIDEAISKIAAVLTPISA